MALRLRPLAMLERLRSTYWFLPAVVTIAAVVLAQALVTVDRAYGDTTAWLGWAYGGGADGARALLSAVAGSTMTVVSVTFSVMVVALTVSSQHFGPRLLNSFMRDTAAQLVLGTFTGTFAYCLMVLRTVQGDGDGYSAFVPHLAVTAAFVLALLSIGTLIYYVHHIATSLQVSEIAAGVARDLERTVERLYPEAIGEDSEMPVRDAPAPPADALPIRARSSGYLQEIDDGAVLSLATEAGTIIWITVRPGDFLLEGSTVAMAFPVPRDPREFARRAAQAFAAGADRTSTQDADFAVQQLVEVALRALSPGVNEPFTAITCIDRLTQGLARLAARRIPGAVRTGEDGSVRVVAQPRTFVELLHDAFEPIGTHAGSNTPVVAERLLQALRSLASVARRAADREAIAGMADRVFTAASLPDGRAAGRGTGASLAALRDAVRQELAGGVAAADAPRAVS